MNFPFFCMIFASITLVGCSSFSAQAAQFPIEPIAKAQENKAMPVMAPAQEQVAMHVYNSCIYVGKKVPDGILQDILLFNGDEQVSMTLRSPHGVEGQAYSLLDGNPNTVCNANPKQPRAVHLNFLRIQPVTHLVVRTTDHTQLKGVRVLLFNTHWDVIYDQDLGFLANSEKAPAYRIDLKTNVATPLQTVEGVDVYQHPAITDLIDGTAVRVNPEDTSGQIPGAGLAEGQSVAVTWLQAGQIPFEGDQYEITLGDASFTLMEHKTLQLSDGSRFHVRRGYGEGPVELTLMLTRGSGETANEVTWKVFGFRNDIGGIATLENAAVALPVTVKHVRGKGKNPPVVSLKALAIGKAQETLPAVRKAVPEMEWKELETSVYGWNTPRLIGAIAKDYGIDLPNITMADIEAGPTPEEVETFIEFATKYPLPKSNKNNKIIFGIEQGSRGIYRMLCSTGRPELLVTLEKWAAAILSHRNDKRYKVPVVANNSITPNVQANTLVPTWPMFNKPRGGYLDGLPVTTTLTIGPALVPMLNYAEYIFHHPVLWDQPSATDATKTHKQLAMEFVREAELSIDFSIEHFVEPNTKRVSQPWNRYAAFIDACLTLSSIYETMEGKEAQFDNAPRKQLYTDIVNAYIGYMKDDKKGGHVRSYLRNKHELVPVMTMPYAPLSLWWGARAEKMGYSCLDYTLHMAAFSEGRFGKSLTDAHAFELGYSWALRVFAGYDKKGQRRGSKNVNGSGGFDRGDISAVHRWTGAYVPEAYTRFDQVVSDEERVAGASEVIPGTWGMGMHGFGEHVWLREMLLERGLFPHKRTSPRIKIKATAKHVRPGEEVAFAVVTAGKGQKITKGVQFAWDVNEDGVADGTGPVFSHTFTESGIYPVTVRISSADGKWAPALKTIVVNDMLPGTGKGYGHVNIWCETLEGENIDAMKKAQGYPNAPEMRMKVGALDLDGLQKPFPLKGRNAGFEFTAYLIPSVTGDYDFSVNSGQNSELWLSSDETEENLQKIGWTHGYRERGHYEYHYGQKSKTIHLEAGKRYRICGRAWVKGGCGEYFSAAWKLSNSKEYLPIEGEYLSPIE